MALGVPVINSKLSGYVCGTCPVVNYHIINVRGEDPAINSTVSEVIYDLVINSTLLGYMGGRAPVINSTLLGYIGGTAPVIKRTLLRLYWWDSPCNQAYIIRLYGWDSPCNQ